MKKEEKVILGKFGKVWASLGKLGQGNKLEKWGKRQKELEKGKKFEW